MSLCVTSLFLASYASIRNDDTSLSRKAYSMIGKALRVSSWDFWYHCIIQGVHFMSSFIQLHYYSSYTLNQPRSTSSSFLLYSLSLLPYRFCLSMDAYATSPYFYLNHSQKEKNGQGNEGSVHVGVLKKIRKGPELQHLYVVTPPHAAKRWLFYYYIS